MDSSPTPPAQHKGFTTPDQKPPAFTAEGKSSRPTRRLTPELWKIIVLFLLSIISLKLGVPAWLSWLLAGFAAFFLIAHSWPEHVAQILSWLHDNIRPTLGWLRENIKVTAVGALATISGFLVLNYTNGLRQEIDLIRAAGDAERSQSSEAIRSRDDKIQNLLSAIVNVPVLLSPQNNRSRASVDHVVLQWASLLAYDHYIVEITRFDSSGKPIMKPIPATNPVQMSTLYPSGFTVNIQPGIYFWRVAAGDLEEGAPAPKSSWSGYYRFDIFGSAVERIHQNHHLTVGVTYNQNSDFMRRDEDGKPYGFDAALMSTLSDKLRADSEINVDPSKWQQPQVIEYPSIDALLRIGIIGGEVDFALSSVTKTRYRENLKIKFTDGYFDSHLVLLSRAGVGLQTLKDAEVGAIEKTTNAYALNEFCHLHHCKPVQFKSFQDTLNALTEGTVRFILADEPLSMQMIQQKQVTVVRHDVASELPDYRSLIGYPKEQYAIATPDLDLQLKLTKIIKNLKEDGALRHLQDRYHLLESPSSR